MAGGGWPGDQTGEHQKRVSQRETLQVAQLMEKSLASEYATLVSFHEKKDI